MKKKKSLFNNKLHSAKYYICLKRICIPQKLCSSAQIGNLSQIHLLSDIYHDYT